jgi:hypothetical protein
MRRGRLSAALAGYQLSRRPGAVRLFALITAAVAVTGYAAAAVDVAARGRAEQAGVGTGAARVVSVGPVSRRGLLAAVHEVDPDGRYAMAAVRLPAGTTGQRVLAVDTRRLGAVATWGGTGPGPAEATARLRPAEPSPYRLSGARLTLDITAENFQPGRPVSVTAVLSPVGGLADEVAELGELASGRQAYAVDTPGCAGGCELKTLQIAARQGSVDVTGRVSLHAIGGVPVSSATWRSTQGGRVTTDAGGLVVEVASLNGLTEGIFLQPGGVPFPMPVAAAGPSVPATLTGLDNRPLPVAPVLRLPVVPGLGVPAVLADLDYADRLATDATLTGTGQVWLAASAPTDVTVRLRDAGLVVTADVRAEQVRAGLDEQGPALALWFYVIVAALATALAAGALVLAAAVDRPRRIEDLSALRGQGLDRAAVRRATLWAQPVLVAAAVLAGTGIALLGWRLTGWALPLAGLDAPAFPLPLLPRAGTTAATAAVSFVVLAGAAVLAGRRTLREIR